MHRTEPSLEKFFDLSLDLLCIAGMDGMFKKVNPAFMELLGWPESVLLSRPFFDFVHPDDVEATQKEMEKLKDGKATIRFENRYQCADGSYRLLRWTSRPDTETGYLYAVARDVTQQKEIEAELLSAKEAAEAADLAKSTFLASISHEIRTPMSGVLGMADFALERVDDPELERSLQVIRQSSESLLTLINDLLDLSKIEAGHIDFDPAPFELRRTVGSAVRSLSIQAQRRGLELTLEVDPSLPDALVGDAARLRQVLVNLIGNAIKFTDAGEVNVLIRKPPPSSIYDKGKLGVTFEVQDTGIGMSPEVAAHAFEPFWQGKSAPGKARGGTGLGLAICSQLVKMMGGEFEVQSAPGEGTSFSFTAIFERQEATSESWPTLQDAGVLSGARVLVIEPRASSRRALLSLLSEWDFETRVTDDVETAKAELHSAREECRPFEVVLVPCSSSRDDLEQLRRLIEFLGDDRNENVVSILPSVRSAGLLRRCQALGLAGYLIEPVIFEDMRRMVRRLGKLEPARKDSAAQKRRYDGRALNVLLVEDSPINQQVIRALLESRGHRLQITGDGESGLEAFKSDRFDLVLMDVGLPGKSGPEIAREIRALEAHSSAPRIPILAITADATGEQRSACAAAGMDATLVKPVRSRSLFDAIDRFLGEILESTERSSCPDDRQPEQDADGIDWAAALEVTGGDEQLLEQIVEAAREEIPSVFSAIEAALAEEDLVSVARGAHTIRGSCRYFGAEDLAQAAQELEKSAHEGSLGKTRKSIKALVEPLDRLLAELNTAEILNRPEAG